MRYLTTIAEERNSLIKSSGAMRPPQEKKTTIHRLNESLKNVTSEILRNRVINKPPRGIEMSAHSLTLPKHSTRTSTIITFRKWRVWKMRYRKTTNSNQCMNKRLQIQNIHIVCICYMQEDIIANDAYRWQLMKKYMDQSPKHIQ